MPGFSTSISDGQNLVFANNADFSGGSAQANGILKDGQLWIGSSVVNAGGTHINVAKLSSPDSSILIGHDPLTGNITLEGMSTADDLHAARYIVSTGGFANGANYTTIAAAYAAAVTAGAPQTVFIQPGTYTENLTLTAGINITAFTSDGYRDLAAATDAVIIIGKMTMTTAGTVAIANVQLRTSSDYFLEVTGVAASIVYLDHCYLNCLNNTGIHSTSTSSEIRLINCAGNLSTTGISYFALSGGGNLEIFGGDFNNSGSSTTASTWSAGILTIRFCEFDSFLTSSGNGGANIYSTFFNAAGLNTTVITHNSTGTASSIWHSQLYSGSASAVSIGAGAGLNMYECEIGSTNTNAITGAGTLKYGDLVFIASSSVMNVTTQTPVYTTGQFLAKGSYAKPSYSFQDYQSIGFFANTSDDIAVVFGSNGVVDFHSNTTAINNILVTNGGQTCHVTVPGAYPYTALSSDYFIAVTTSGAGVGISLPVGNTGVTYIIKDVSGAATASPITITPAAGNIDGSGTYVIASNYGSVKLIYNGTAWSVC
jgi:hypothetical protein